MLRWHLDSCSQPKVRAQKEDLACRACGQSIPHDASLPDHRKFRALSQAPTERTCLDLKWPESVEYTQECILQYGGRDLTEPLVKYIGKPSKLVSKSDRLENLSRHGFPALPSEQHIRVLLLSPARRWGHPLHGDLQVQDLDGRPYYEALSYTWSDETGDASLNRRIYIGPAWDGMPITRSCSRALRRLRLDQLARPLWIDAICINQINNAEKSHQIALMRKIYVNCIRCIVDLGEPTKDSHLAFDRLNGTVTRDEYSLSLPATSDQHAALAALLRRPYFRRIWIIQEITSSPQVQVVCGSCSADLRLLRVRFDASSLDEHSQHPNRIKQARE
ncbi:Heterokaryon incompatibility protein 6- OR allele [Apiospora arundinis]